MRQGSSRHTHGCCITFQQARHPSVRATFQSYARTDADRNHPTVSAVPSDLRHAHKPVHSLLSQAYAGSPGDDVLDISIIREHWMRSKVLELYASSDHSLSLK